MCTAVTYKTRDHYFGRNFDFEMSYGEGVVIVPRAFPLEFRRMGVMRNHYALIGMAIEVGGIPLFFDAINEKGLGMAGLNFPGNACYGPELSGKDNVPPFEFIPWILGQCASLREVRALLERINLANINFSDDLPLTPLHWMIADCEGSIVVECMRDGMKVWENPVGVLTNNPPFDWQMMNLNNYMHLSVDAPENRFSPQLDLKPFSRGMGAMGMPGDLSSQSRFVRAAFTRMNSRSGHSESESISQFFHILGSVAQQRGLVRMEDGQYEITRYSCCCNLDRGIYYYTSYENSRVTAVDMHRENLDGNALITYPIVAGQQIYCQN